MPVDWTLIRFFFCFFLRRWTKPATSILLSTRRLPANIRYPIRFQCNMNTKTAKNSLLFIGDKIKDVHICASLCWIIIWKTATLIWIIVLRRDWCKEKISTVIAIICIFSEYFRFRDFLRICQFKIPLDDSVTNSLLHHHSYWMVSFSFDWIHIRILSSPISLALSLSLSFGFCSLVYFFSISYFC